MKINYDLMPKAIREKQRKTFEAEITSVLTHYKNAQRLVKDIMPKQAKVLILDISQGCFDQRQINDPGLLDVIQQIQFGGGTITYGEIFRMLLGFSIHDSRVVIWDAAKEPNSHHLPDLSTVSTFIVTGGPAMPSELSPGSQTQNTGWLNKAIEVMNNLIQARIPGLGICLGHQLLNHIWGSTVGKSKEQREFGSVRLCANNLGKKIKLMKNCWDKNGTLCIQSSHSESVIQPTQNKQVKYFAFNEYSEFQASVFSLNHAQSIEEANEKDQLIVTLQHHPEFMSLYMEILKRTRRQALLREGIDLDTMIFHNTEKARQIFLNFIELTAKRCRL